MKVINYQIPMDKDGNFLLSPEEARRWKDSLQESVPEGCVVTVTPFKSVEEYIKSINKITAKEALELKKSSKEFKLEEMKERIYETIANAAKDGFSHTPIGNYTNLGYQYDIGLYEKVGKHLVEADGYQVVLKFGMHSDGSVKTYPERMVVRWGAGDDPKLIAVRPTGQDDEKVSEEKKYVQIKRTTF